MAWDLNDEWRAPNGQKKILSKLDAAAMEKRNRPNGTNGKHPKAPPIPEEQLHRIAREIQIRLIPWDEITLSLTPQFLIRDLYPLTGLAVVYGPPKEGKTFFVFDSVMHVALGRPYRGHRVMQGPVVYCLFEGQRNFAARKEAFRLKHLKDHGEKVPFYLVPVRMQLVQDHPRLIEAIKTQLGSSAPRAVVIDTLNRSFTGDENPLRQ